MKQLDLFGNQMRLTAKRTHRGGSQNPAVFRDYDSFVANRGLKSCGNAIVPQVVYEIFRAIEIAGTKQKAKL